MPICTQCDVERFPMDMGEGGICLECHASEFSRPPELLASPCDSTAQSKAAARIILTTETAHNLPVAERLDIVTAEVVIGMHLFKDIGAMFRDTFGGRSKIMQQGLREARETALAELRLEALNLGADAVVGVDLDYSEISGQGKSMLLLVASGTAVSLARPT